MNYSKEITILINSFDGYCDIWNYFFKIFDFYWENCPFEKKLVTNYLSYDGIEVIKTGKEIDWVTRTLHAIDKIDTSYVLLLLEDYFLSTEIDSSYFFDITNFVIKNNINYLRLIEIPKSRHRKKNKTFFSLYDNEEYGINLQASIWNVKYLKELLEEIKEGSAWDFEVYLLKKTIDKKEKIMEGCYTLKGNPFGFHNGVLKGKWFRREIKYYKKIGINIDYSKRGRLSVFAEKKFIFLQSMKNVLPYCIRKFVKKVLKKIGFKFVSNF